MRLIFLALFAVIVLGAFIGGLYVTGSMIGFI